LTGGELARIDLEERSAPADLCEMFQHRLTQNLHRFPLLRGRLNCAVLFNVEGEPGGLWEVDLRRPSGWFRHGDSGDWDLRVTIPGARAKEGLLDRLINTPSPFWFLRTVLAPRFAQLMIHRRQEFSHILRAKLTAS
jgi:hypothetical protein